jgi:hypothetical protein
MTSCPSRFRLRARFQCDTPWSISEMFFEGTRLVAEGSLFHHIAFLMDDAIAAHFVA